MAWTEEQFDKLADVVKENAEAIKRLTESEKEMQIRFDSYQKATQWVVNLAFSLIASATITVLVTSILRNKNTQQKVV